MENAPPNRTARLIRHRRGRIEQSTALIGAISDWRAERRVTRFELNALLAFASLSRAQRARFSRAIASAASIASPRCEETGLYLPTDRTLEQFRLRFISEPDSLRIISVLDIADQLDPDPDDDGTDPDPATPPICTPVLRKAVDAIGASRSRHGHGRSRKRGVGKAVPAKIRPAKGRKGLKIARRRQSPIDDPIRLAKRTSRPRRFRFVKAH